MNQPNGKPAPPPTTIPELRDRRQRLRLEMEVRRLERAQKLMESFPSPDYLGAVVDLLDRYRDGNQLLSPISTPNDRRWGRNFPMWQTEQDLALLRMPARIMCATNSAAIGLMSGLTSYVIGPGFTYRAVPRKGAKREVPKALVAAAQEVLDEFGDRVCWPELEQELFHRTREDGESLTRHFLTGDGLTEVRTIEPEQLMQPAGSDQRVWSFGIRTDPEDTQRIERFYVSYLADPADGEEVPASEIVFAKVNTKKSIKRGVTDFWGDTYESLLLAAKLRRNMGEGAAVQAAIAAVLQHDNASQQAVAAYQAQLNDGATTDPVTGRGTDYQKVLPGTQYQVPKGWHYIPPPGATNAEAHAAVYAILLRSAGQRWNAPEWLGSGDASNNNYASSLTAESPFVKTCERWQNFYRHRFKQTMLIVLVHAVEAGRLPAEVLELIDVEVKAPSVEARNRLQEAQTNQVEVATGYKSRQMCADEQGYDWERVQKDNDEFLAETGGAGADLPLPGDGNGLPGLGGGSTTGFPESLRRAIRDELTALLEKRDAQGHEHGGDGRFASGGGGSGGTGSSDLGPPPGLGADEHQELARELPQAAAKPGLWARVKETYSKVRTVAFAVGTDIALKLGRYAPDVLLEARDFEKVTTQPGADPVSAAIGLGTNDAIKIASVALGRAYVWVKGKLGQKESAGTPDLDAIADAVVAVRQKVNDALGAALPLPDRDELVARLHKRLGGPKLESQERDELKQLDRVLLEAGFTGTVKDKRGRTYHYVDGKRVAAAQRPGGQQSHTEPKPEAAQRAAQRLAGGEPVSAGELRDFHEHLGSLTVPQLRRIREQLRASFKGGRRKDQMLEALQAHVSGTAKPDPERSYRLDPPPEDVGPREHAVRTFPQLKPIIWQMQIESPDSSTARGHIADLARLPVSLHQRLAKAGLREIVISDKPIVETDHNDFLRGQRPRGWREGATWDTVAGGYNPQKRQVVAGGWGDGGKSSVATHEYGHAVGHLLDLDNHPTLDAAHRRLYNRLSAYEQQGGPGGSAGKEELLAESVWYYARGGQAEVAKRYDDAHAEWLHRELTRAN